MDIEQSSLMDSVRSGLGHKDTGIPKEDDELSQLLGLGNDDQQLGELLTSALQDEPEAERAGSESPPRSSSSKATPLIKDTKKVAFQDSPGAIIKEKNSLEKRHNSLAPLQFQQEQAEDSSDISAYARLDFATYTFYVQTLQVILGRRSENDQSHQVDVNLGPSKAISRRHAQIFYNFGTERFELSIMGKNGAFVDDTFIERGITVELHNKTKIQIGQISFQFNLPSSDNETKKPTNPAEAISLKTALIDSGNKARSRSGSLPPEIEELEVEETPQIPLVISTPIVPKVQPPVIPSIVDDPKKKKDKKQPKPPKPPKKVYTLDEIPPEYRTKPTCSYSTLISACLKEHSTEKGMSLSEIYKAIQELFPYYKYCPDGWQSSVRHNLSLNKSFRKVSKEGKGWLWGLDEEYCAEKERARKKQAEVAAAKAKSLKPEPSRLGVNIPLVNSQLREGKGPSISQQLAANRGVSKPEPKKALSDSNQRTLNYLQEQLVVLTKDRKGLDKATTAQILTQALAMTISQVTQAAKSKGITGNPLTALIDKNPHHLTMILTAALNAATAKVTKGKVKSMITSKPVMPKPVPKPAARPTIPLSNSNKVVKPMINVSGQKMTHAEAHKMALNRINVPHLALREQQNRARPEVKAESKAKPVTKPVQQDIASAVQADIASALQADIESAVRADIESAVAFESSSNSDDGNHVGIRRDSELEALLAGNEKDETMDKSEDVSVDVSIDDKESKDETALATEETGPTDETSASRELVDEPADLPENKPESKPEDDPMNELEDELEDQPMNEHGDELEDESADQPIDESKEESNDESKDESKEESKDESKDDSKDESKDGSKDESKDGSKDESKDGSKDESVEQLMDQPNDQPVDTITDQPKDQPTPDAQAEPTESNTPPPPSPSSGDIDPSNHAPANVTSPPLTQGASPTADLAAETKDAAPVETHDTQGSEPEPCAENAPVALKTSSDEQQESHDSSNSNSPPAGFNADYSMDQSHVDVDIEALLDSPDFDQPPIIGFDDLEDPEFDIILKTLSREQTPGESPQEPAGIDQVLQGKRKLEEGVESESKMAKIE